MAGGSGSRAGSHRRGWTRAQLRRLRARLSSSDVSSVPKDLNRLQHAFLAWAVPTIYALPVETVSREAVRIPLRRGSRDGGQESGAQSAHDGPGNFVLNGPHVLQRTIV